MNNAEMFKKVFGIYAEEFWAYPKEKMLDWLASDVHDTNVGDLTSRKAAIDALIAEGRNVDSRYLESERIIHESDAVEVISLLPSAQSWTPVSERLPDTDGYYLVFAPDYSGGSSTAKENHNGVMFSRFAKGKWSVEHGYYTRPGCVKAWMPLTKPYKEEKNDAMVH